MSRIWANILLACMLLWVSMVGGCLKLLDPTGVPCNRDADCWSKLICVDKRCALEGNGPLREAAIPDASQPDEEPPPEPQKQQGTRDVLEECFWEPFTTPFYRCKNGLSCVRQISGKAVCLKDCSQDASVCQGERKVCRLIAWKGKADLQAQRVCVKEALSGQPCDPLNGLYCATNASPPSTCQEGTCVPIALVGEGETCDAKKGDALTTCDLQKKLMCDSNNRCIRNETRYPMQLCGDDDTPNEVCPIGTECVLFEGVNKYFCATLCTKEPNEEDICKTISPGFQCVLGLCRRVSCQGDLDCRNFETSHYCSEQPNTAIRACYIRPTNQTKQFGERCFVKTSADSEDCVGNLRCFTVFAGNPTGTCLPVCRTNAECSFYDANMSCSLRANTGSRFCAYSCKQDTDCPQGMSCNTQFQVCGNR